MDLEVKQSSPVKQSHSKSYTRVQSVHKNARNKNYSPPPAPLLPLRKRKSLARNHASFLGGLAHFPSHWSGPAAAGGGGGRAEDRG